MMKCVAIVFLVTTIAPALTFAQAGSDVMSDDQRVALDSCVDRGLAWLASEQQPDGSFPTMPHGQPGVTSLCIMAFLAHGHLPGEGPYGEALERAVNYVENCFSDDYGTFGYTAQGRALSRGMAGAGILALAHAGKHDSRRATAAGDWLLRYSFTDYNRDIQFGRGIDSKDRYHYALFNCCQGMYQLGGRYWAEFFPPTAQTLIDHQRADGSWPPDSRGSDTPFGNSYTTSLVLLSLGAPNQLLPIFQR